MLSTAGANADRYQGGHDPKDTDPRVRPGLDDRPMAGLPSRRERPHVATVVLGRRSISRSPWPAGGAPGLPRTGIARYPDRPGHLEGPRGCLVPGSPDIPIALATWRGPAAAS